MPKSPTANAETGPGLPPWFCNALKSPGRSASVYANGMRMHYLGWNLDETKKPVLLLLHGFRSHAHWWDWTAPHFAADYRIIAPDLSGMGDSDHRQNYHPDTWAEDVTALLDATRFAPVIAVGHSYGGSTLLRACLRRPDLFSRLILLDTTLPLPDEASQPPPPPRPTTNTCYPTLEAAMSRFTLRPHQAIGLPYVLQHIARHSARKDEDGWRWKFDPVAYPFDRYRFDADQLLASIRRPVNYIRAECSGTTRPARAKALAEMLQKTVGCRMIEIPDAHHHIMIDQPLALIAVLRALLLQHI